MRTASRLPLRRYAIWFAVLAASLLLFAFNREILTRNQGEIWGGGHDMKYYAIVARNFAEGRGFLRDAIHVSELKEGIANLKAYNFFFLHPFFAGLIMKLRGDHSFLPLFQTTAWYALFTLPLLFLLLSRFLSPWRALALTALFLFSPLMTGENRIGLTEPLMMLLLTALFLVYFSISNVFLNALLGGLLLGLLAVTRPTGLLLLPAFLYLGWKTKGSRYCAVFLVGFFALSSVGRYIENQGALHAVRFSDFTRETAGGPDFNLYRPVPLTPAQQNLPYLKPILQKVWSFTVGMGQQIFLFLSDFWVFLPGVLILAFRRKSPWAGFLALSLLATYASIVFFWFEPRVSLHLTLMCLLAAALYGRHYQRNFTKLSIWTGMGFAGVFLLICWFGGSVGRMVIETVLAAFFAISLLVRVRVPHFKEYTAGAVFGLYLALGIQGFRAHQRDNFSPPNAGLSDSLISQMQSIGVLGDREKVLLIANNAHDVSWYSGLTALYFPSNLKQTLPLLHRFGRRIYFVILDPDNTARDDRFLQGVPVRRIPLGSSTCRVFEEVLKPSGRIL